MRSPDPIPGDLGVKALSVDRQGQPDGFTPTDFYSPQVIPGGYSRLCISLGAVSLPVVHRRLTAALGAPLHVLYRQLTDRSVGQLSKPRDRVAVDVDPERVDAALQKYAALIYRDGRHQLWLRGSAGEQLVLDELGMVFLYPDDPLFRELLAEMEIPLLSGETMADRDYVRVNFLAGCDSEETGMIEELGMVPWKG